jgi:hypothetical protein
VVPYKSFFIHVSGSYLVVVLATPAEGLIFRFIAYHSGGAAMDSQMAYDMLLVVWVMGLALYLFHLGRLAGAARWNR